MNSYDFHYSSKLYREEALREASAISSGWRGRSVSGLLS